MPIFSVRNTYIYMDGHGQHKELEQVRVVANYFGQNFNIIVYILRGLFVCAQIYNI